MFRAFGHDNVAVLDGGLLKWRAEGRGITDVCQHPRQPIFPASLNEALLRLASQVNDNVSAGVEQVVDARGAGCYNGTEPNRAPVFVRVTYQIRQCSPCRTGRMAP